MKRLLIPTLVLALAAAACGGDDEAAPATTEAVVTTAGSATTDVTDSTMVAPTLASPPTTDAPSTTETPTTTEPPATTMAPATTVADDDPSVNTDVAAVAPIPVAAPGVVPLSNPAGIAIVEGLAQENGMGSDAAAVYQSLGVDTVPHVLFENATLFDVSGSVDATFVDDQGRPDYSTESMFIVQMDTPDPNVLLTALAESIGATGAFDSETGSFTQDEAEIFAIELSPTNFEDDLPRWELQAADLAPVDPALSGLLQVWVQSYGKAPGLSIPTALQALDAQARAEAPSELTPTVVKYNIGIGLFGGFPIDDFNIRYTIDGYSDFDTAFAAFTDAIGGSYDEPYVDEEYASWTSETSEWVLLIDFEDKVAVEFGTS